MRDPGRPSHARPPRLVEEDLSVALVYAEIGGQYFGDVQRRHPDRVINVGIREQLLVNVGAGLALTGMRPVVHTFGSFLVERAFEQVSSASTTRTSAACWSGRRLLRDVSGGGPHAPGARRRRPDGRPCPAGPCTSPARRRRSRPRRRSRSPGPGATTCASCRRSTRRRTPVRPGRFHVVRRGSGPTVVAVGPMLSATLAATEGLDATVLYANVGAALRPPDPAGGGRAGARGGARGALPGGHVVAAGRRHVRRRAAPAAGARGAGRRLRRYGRPEDHIAAHGLDEAGLRWSIERFAGTVRTLVSRRSGAAS